MCDDVAVVIRCHECRSLSYLCALCDQEVHTAHPLHDREYWNEKFFTFIIPTQSPDSVTGNLSDVGMINFMHKIIIVTGFAKRGLIHTSTFQLCRGITQPVVK